MKHSLLFFLLTSAALFSEPCLETVEVIWEKDEHAAFTDLIATPQGLMATFRAADSHERGQDGTIRVICQNEKNRWDCCVNLALHGFDLRDPKISYTPEGELMLLCGAVEKSGMRYPCVFFSKNGRKWGQPNLIASLPGEWIWRLTWKDSQAWGISYKADPANLKDPWQATLFKTSDGLDYEKVTALEVDDLYPNEGTLRFEGDTMLALLRAQKTGFTGKSTPPYTDWEWKPLGERLGGPNFLILKDGTKIASSRKLFFSEEGELIDEKVIVARLDDKEGLSPLFTLPSSGDCSYPGMVEQGKMLYISYYSSHEGKAKIYLARISLEKD